jgi:kynurenine formamidase
MKLGGSTDFTDDLLLMGCQTTTQWDALCHLYYDNLLYNGYPAETVSSEGARFAGIDKVHTDMVGRGVLLDFPRYFGIDVLEPGYGITGPELENCAKSHGVEIMTGDFLLVRTGLMSLVHGDDWTEYYKDPRPGLHYSATEWIAEKCVATVSTDTSGVEAFSELLEMTNPFHMVALRDMGVHLGEFWYLEELAEDCAADGVYEFMLVAQPLRIEGGAGSPLNPLAIK